MMSEPKRWESSAGLKERRGLKMPIPSVEIMTTCKCDQADLAPRVMS